MAKFDNVRKGNRVWSVVHNWGTVAEMSKGDRHTVFQVDFDNGKLEMYILDGRRNEKDLNPTLFWNEFHIPTDEEDKKPFDLVEFLKENLEPKEFEQNTNNIYLHFSYVTNRCNWSSTIMIECIGEVYFEVNNELSHIVDILNENKITSKELKQAYKELGWL